MWACAHGHLGVPLQNHRIHVQMHTSTHSALAGRTPEGTATPAQGDCCANMTMWRRHFSEPDSCSTPIPVLLLSLAALPYAPNATVINFLLAGRLLVKGPVYLSHCGDRPQSYIPPLVRHLETTHLYLPICQVTAEGPPPPRT